MAIVNEKRFELSIRGTVHQFMQPISVSPQAKYEIYLLSYLWSMHLVSAVALSACMQRDIRKESKAPEVACRKHLDGGGWLLAAGCQTVEDKQAVRPAGQGTMSHYLPTIQPSTCWLKLGEGRWESGCNCRSVKLEKYRSFGLFSRRYTAKKAKEWRKF